MTLVTKAQSAQHAKTGSHRHVYHGKQQRATGYVQQGSVSLNPISSINLLLSRKQQYRAPRAQLRVHGLYEQLHNWEKSYKIELIFTTCVRRFEFSTE